MKRFSREETIIETVRPKYRAGKPICPECDVELEYLGEFSPLTKRPSPLYKQYKCPKCNYNKQT